MPDDKHIPGLGDNVVFRYPGVNGMKGIQSQHQLIDNLVKRVVIHISKHPGGWKSVGQLVKKLSLLIQIIDHFRKLHSQTCPLIVFLHVLLKFTVSNII